MGFYRFKDEDIINTSIVANPYYSVSYQGDAITGSIYLEKPSLNDDLLNRRVFGFSAAEGGFVTGSRPLTASIDIVDAELNATNKQLYESIINLYNHYALINSDYTPYFTGSETTRFRVIAIPEIYYDRGVLTGSLTASDLDNAGDTRILYDNGRGGIYSGSLSGTLVGNIFYSEGLVVLKGGGLNDESTSNDFGEASPSAFKWSVDFRGVQTIPVKIFRCRAPAGQLNASSNPTFYSIPTASLDVRKNEREIVLDDPFTYITTIGLFNKNYELVALAKLAQPVKKEEQQDILFRVRLDF